jgi:hypothetical protein
MRYRFLALLASLILLGPSLSAQQIPDFNYQNFEEQVLNFKPKEYSQFDASKADFASMVLEETRSATKSNPTNFNLADYYNILSVFQTLQLQDEYIWLAYQKFKDNPSSCEYIVAFEKTTRENDKYELIREDWLAQIPRCSDQVDLKELSVPEYIAKYNLDAQLVETLAEIDERDQVFRGLEVYDGALQGKLDRINQVKMDSLFAIHKTYIGKSLAGPKYGLTMWSVIQHSYPDMMMQYLPVVHQAYLDGEIDLGPFKMLIDRSYGLNHGYQVFGSQHGFGFEMATEEQRKQIREQFDIP